MAELLFLILLMIVVAAILQVDFVIYVAYVLIAVYVFSRWYVPRSISRLQVSRRFHDHAFLSESVQIDVCLSNLSRLPVLWLQVVESVPPELRSGPAANHVIHLRSRETRRLSYHVRAMKRGYYRLGPMQLTAGDLFGFQEIRATVKPDYLTVYPRIVPLTALDLPSKLPFGTLTSKQRLFEDPARPQGVRDYQFGDSLRLVNWKVSAHSGDLLVRTHQPAISLETAILLNLNTREYSPRFRRDGPEWSIVLAASLASHLVSRRQSVGLISNGADPLLSNQASGPGEPQFDDASGRLLLSNPDQDSPDAGHEPPSAAALIADPIPPKPGRAHLMQILARLARLEGAPTTAFSPYAYRATQQLNWGVTVMAIVPNADDDTCDMLHRLVRAGFNVILLVTEQYAYFSPVRERSRLLGFKAYHVPDQPALRQWQQAAADVR